MINAILKLIGGRIVVRTKIVPQMVEYLKFDLSKKGFAHVDKICGNVGLIVVEDALRRAAEMEKDGRPRYGQFNKQIELAADHIIAAFKGDQNVDPRIKSILVFHNLL